MYSVSLAHKHEMVFLIVFVFVENVKSAACLSCTRCIQRGTNLSMFYYGIESSRQQEISNGNKNTIFFKYEGRHYFCIFRRVRCLASLAAVRKRVFKHSFTRQHLLQKCNWLPSSLPKRPVHRTEFSHDSWCHFRQFRLLARSNRHRSSNRDLLQMRYDLNSFITIIN